MKIRSMWRDFVRWTVLAGVLQIRTSCRSLFCSPVYCPAWPMNLYNVGHFVCLVLHRVRKCVTRRYKLEKDRVEN